MKSTHWLLSITILLLTVMAVPTVSAQGGGPYVGGTLGSSDDEVLDQTGSSFKIFGGYQFTKNIAVEAALVDLGEFDFLGLPNALEQWGLAYGIVGIVPVGHNGAVFAKAGFFDWSVDYLSRTVDEGTDLTLGVGAEYGFDNWGVRVEWERFSDVSDADVDLFSAGVIYRFR